MADEFVVTSDDGTRLWATQGGAGQPLVFVHGTMGTSGDWHAVADRLSGRYRSVAFDRRGRGRSSDTGAYSIDREVDDVIAIIEHCGHPVHLVGHSFGAVVALMAAAATPERIATLTVYEPPIGGDGDGSSLADRLDALVAEGRLDDAIGLFSGAASGDDDHLAGVGEDVRAMLRDAVRTAGREVRAAGAVLPLDPRIVASLRMPVLVLLGDRQQLATYDGVRALAQRLPRGEVASVPGNHLAHLFEPHAVAERIDVFIARCDRMPE